MTTFVVELLLIGTGWSLRKAKGWLRSEYEIGFLPPIIFSFQKYAVSGHAWLCLHHGYGQENRNSICFIKYAVL